MAPREELLELAAHGEGVFPVVGGTGGVFRERADEGAIFDAGYVVGGGPGIEAAGPELLVEAGKGAGLDEAIAEKVVLGLGAVDPVDGVRLGKIGHLFHPANEVFVGGEGCGDCGGFHGCGGLSFALKSSLWRERCQSRTTLSMLRWGMRGGEGPLPRPPYLSGKVFDRRGLGLDFFCASKVS